MACVTLAAGTASSTRGGVSWGGPQRGQQARDVDLEEEDGAVEVEAGGDPRVHLADDARLLFAGEEQRRAAAQEAVVLAGAEVDVSAGAQEELLERSEKHTTEIQ